TEADLDWRNKQSRSSIEMNNPASRPELARRRDDIEDFDVIFVGFPIWWYTAPTIINTFLESYDFTDKTIVLFATSGGSGMGDTVEKLRTSCPGAKLIEGKILNPDSNIRELAAWVDGLGIQ
ncbi:MAG: NAD(P)H-dependent oxidoreductase, partial [Clostridia bacterium]|nr:NAD(P)H-dependent oxidoreductase [Clostridia bacterium]